MTKTEIQHLRRASRRVGLDLATMRAGRERVFAFMIGSRVIALAASAIEARRTLARLS